MASLETDCSSSEPAYPGHLAVDQSVREFISSFFAASDMPGMTDEWVGYFLDDDATLVMGRNEAVGREGLFCFLVLSRLSRRVFIFTCLPRL